MNALIVAASTALLRIFPLIVGVIVVRIAGAGDYADFVLSLSMLNVLAICIQLSVVPQLIRSDPNSEWGDFVGLAALSATWLFVPVAATVIGIRFVQQQSTMSLAVAAGTSFGMLTGAIAIAILCRRRAFVTLLKHAIAFATLCIAPLLAAGMLGAVAHSYIAVYGVWIGLVGCGWLLVVARTRKRDWSWLVSQHLLWRELGRDAIYSASFGVMMMSGLYLTNVAATHIADLDSRAAVALGLQLFAAVVFLPGALSSFLVPKLIGGGEDVAVRRIVAAAVVGYFVIAAAMAASALLLIPVVEAVYGIAISGEARIGLGFVMLAAVLAATNAVFNQVFVARRQFARQMHLAGLWLLVLSLGLVASNGSTAGPGMALSGAYLLLLLLSANDFLKLSKSGLSAVKRAQR